MRRAASVAWRGASSEAGLAASAAALLPQAAMAHDAFGDLGPFYASMLHPVADPAQGLVLAGAAAFLARQPIATVRLAYGCLAAGGVVAVLAAIAGMTPALPPVAAALFACLLGGGALLPGAAPRSAAAALAGAAGLAAGSAFAADLGGTRDAVLTILGAVLGLVVTPLILWGAIDLAVQRVGPVAAALIGSWVAAVGIMTAALSA